MKEAKSNYRHFFTWDKPITRKLVLITFFICSCLLLVASIYFYPFPIAWAILSWSVFFFMLSRKARGLFLVAFWFNIASIFFIISVFEFVFLAIEVKERSVLRLDRVYEVNKDKILGSSPRKNTSRHAREYINNKLVYDVVITIDSNGLRITPPCGEHCDSTILFFGDSYTFGEGVSDSETMPYLVGKALTGKYRVYNFGAQGYGPHQMLSAIEHGIVFPKVKGNVSQIFYQVIYPEHVLRSIAFWPWVEYVPKYIPGKDGRVSFAGNYENEKERKPRLWEYSAISRKLIKLHPPVHKKDIRLFMAIIIESKKLLLKQYPQAKFHMIVWDWTEGKDKWVFDELEKNGILIHNIANILPDGNKSNMAYKISELDQHPNAYAQELIARYIIKMVKLR